MKLHTTNSNRPALEVIIYHYIDVLSKKWQKFREPKLTGNPVKDVKVRKMFLLLPKSLPLHKDEDSNFRVTRWLERASTITFYRKSENKWYTTWYDLNCSGYEKILAEECMIK